MDENKFIDWQSDNIEELQKEFDALPKGNVRSFFDFCLDEFTDYEAGRGDYQRMMMEDC